MRMRGTLLNGITSRKRRVTNDDAANPRPTLTDGHPRTSGGSGSVPGGPPFYARGLPQFPACRIAIPIAWAAHRSNGVTETRRVDRDAVGGGAWTGDSRSSPHRRDGGTERRRDGETERRRQEGWIGSENVARTAVRGVLRGMGAVTLPGETSRAESRATNDTPHRAGKPQRRTQS